jgi:hypothetical protein
MTFEDWKREVDLRMRATYAIDTGDAGFDEDELRGYNLSRPSPEDFVSWIAEKYDLTPIGLSGRVLSPSS